MNLFEMPTDRLHMKLDALASPSALGPAVEHLDAIATRVFAESQELVPYHTGRLHDSGRKGDPLVTDDGAHVDISYDTPYAISVHEDTVRAYRGGRQAKFLEEPLLRAVSEFPELSASWVKGLAGAIRRG